MIGRWAAGQNQANGCRGAIPIRQMAWLNPWNPRSDTPSSTRAKGQDDVSYTNSVKLHQTPHALYVAPETKSPGPWPWPAWADLLKNQKRDHLLSGWEKSQATDPLARINRKRELSKQICRDSDCRWAGRALAVMNVPELLVQSWHHRVFLLARMVQIQSQHH